DLHDVPYIDWTQLPSAVIGYLVNTVGESPWASSLALAAAVGRGAMREYILRHALGRLNTLLSDVQHLCGIEQVINADV
ncbi:MAG TPA: hypothetical protein VFN02_00245, partial [Ktedonobacteraceae bacterium]|nr:hypothetical protein [Ktedonobacteraceae bacterium]